MKRTYKILAVDDEPLNLFLLKELLEEFYQVVTLQSGLDCLAQIEKIRPDLVLMDVSMPVMDGYETFERLKEIENCKDTPVLFLSALNLIENEIRGLELGAVDYITKPFSGTILLSRINTHIQLLSATRQLRFEQKRTGDIVQKMLQDSRFFRKNIDVFMRSMEKTNGDIVLSAKTLDQRQLVLIGDFTWHGLSAALCGSVVSTVFYTQVPSNVNGATMVNAINLELNEKLPSYMFMVGVLLDFNLETKALKIWNFGLPDVLYFQEGKLSQAVPSQTIPLGVDKNATVDLVPTEVELTKLDQVFVFTDGLTEMKDYHDEMLEVSGVQHFIETQYQSTVPLALQLEKFAREYTQKEQYDDDITCVTLKHYL